MPHAGKQVICPCLTISFPDKVQLARLLEMARRSSLPRRDFYDTKIIYNSIDAGSTIIFKHGYMSAFTTSQQHHPLAKVEVVTQIDWWEEEDHLLVMNRYNIRRSNTTNDGNLRWQNSNPSQLGPDIKTSRMCPHKHPRRWLEQFFREAGWDSPEFTFWFAVCDTIWDPLDPQQRRNFKSDIWDCDCVENQGNKAWPFDDLSIGVLRDLGPIKSLDSVLVRLVKILLFLL